MENRRQSKRIEKLSESPTNKEPKSENKVARQIRDDIAKLNEEVSARMTSMERKLDGIGRVVFGGKPEIQKLVKNVKGIRSITDENTDLLCDLSSTQDCLDSLCNDMRKMHNTLQLIAEAQGIHTEAFESTTSLKFKARASGTVIDIADNNNSAMQDHVKKIDEKPSSSSRKRKFSDSDDDSY